MRARTVPTSNCPKACISCALNGEYTKRARRTTVWKRGMAYTWETASLWDRRDYRPGDNWVGPESLTDIHLSFPKPNARDIPEHNLYLIAACRVKVVRGGTGHKSRDS